MMAKEYLKKIARMESYIQSKKERLAVLKEMSSGISSPKFDDMPRNPNKGRSRLEETILKYIDLENEIKEDEKKLEYEKLYLLEAIGRIEEPEYQTILMILSILVYTFFSRMFDLMLPPVAKHSIVVA